MVGYHTLQCQVEVGMDCADRIVCCLIVMVVGTLLLCHHHCCKASQPKRPDQCPILGEGPIALLICIVVLNCLGLSVVDVK